MKHDIMNVLMIGNSYCYYNVTTPIRKEFRHYAMV